MHMFHSADSTDSLQTKLMIFWRLLRSTINIARMWTIITTLARSELSSDKSLFQLVDFLFQFIVVFLQRTIRRVNESTANLKLVNSSMSSRLIVYPFKLGSGSREKLFYLGAILALLMEVSQRFCNQQDRVLRYRNSNWPLALLLVTFFAFFWPSFTRLSDFEACKWIFLIINWKRRSHPSELGLPLLHLRLLHLAEERFGLEWVASFLLFHLLFQNISMSVSHNKYAEISFEGDSLPFLWDVPAWGSRWLSGRRRVAARLRIVPGCVGRSEED